MSLELVLEAETGIGTSDWYWDLRLVLEHRTGIGASDWYWSLRLVLEHRAGIGASDWYWSIGLVYFTYLQSWMLALQSFPEASLSLKNVLEFEWVISKRRSV
ncbi:uncharacterized protein LOC144626327 [Crassostrea virginica]